MVKAMRVTMKGTKAGRKSKRAGLGELLAGRQGAEAPRGVHGAPPPAAVVQHPPASATKNSDLRQEISAWLEATGDLQFLEDMIKLREASENFACSAIAFGRSVRMQQSPAVFGMSKRKADDLVTLAKMHLASDLDRLEDAGKALALAAAEKPF